MSNNMPTGEGETGQIPRAEPTGLPNGVSSTLRSKAKQKPPPLGKQREALPQAGKKGLRSRAVSKQSAAWDKFTAESPDTLTESTTTIAAPRQAADICKSAVQNHEAAAELKKSEGTADAARHVDTPAQPSQFAALNSGSNQIVEASQPESRGGKDTSPVWPHNESPKQPDGSSGLLNAERQNPPNLHMLEEGTFLPALGQAPLHRAPQASARYVRFLQLSSHL